MKLAILSSSLENLKFTRQIWNWENLYNFFKFSDSQYSSLIDCIISMAISEVEFISETKTTEEEKKLAESLRLPSNFFAYKYQKDCPGCVGCDEEDRKV